MAIGRVFLCIICFVAAQDTIVFPDQTQDSTCKGCEVKIPLELALKLNTITDESQLFREFITKPGVDEVEAPFVKSRLKPIGFSPDSVSDRFGGSDEPVERKAVSKPKPAGCIPELRSVSLRQTGDPWINYWPSCTRVEQCGGCCLHQLLSCQAVETEQLNFQVIVTEYVGNQLMYKGKEIVTVDKHTKCKCDCITKEKDCNSLQEYRKGECRCVCKNRDAEAKCNADNRTMHWDPENCTCDCLEAYECSTGTYFSKSTCRCELIPDETQLINRFSSGDQERNVSFSPPRRRWPTDYLFGNGK